MVSQELLDHAAGEVRHHCNGKGYVQGPNWNPLTPWDSVAALAMAQMLVASGRFEQYVAIAPEGHVYGYFFERLGAKVLSVFVDYPPRRAELIDDLSVVRGQRVLLIEDDVVSGLSLALVVAEMERHEPGTLALYLGREKESQQLENVPRAIADVYLPEDCLDPAKRGEHEAEFVQLFGAPR